MSTISAQSCRSFLLAESNNNLIAEDTMIYSNPNTQGSVVNFKDKYDNYIGGE